MFKRPSIASAVSKFTSAIAELNAVADAQDANITKLDGEIERLAKDRLDAFTERDKARAIATKLADLVA